MENLLLTVNIVFPIFLVMAVGYFCRHSGMLNAEDIVAMNRVSFGVFLPASLCHSLLEVEAGAAVSPGVLAFGFAGTLVVFLLAFLIVPRFERDDARRGGIPRTPPQRGGKLPSFPDNPACPIVLGTGRTGSCRTRTT